MHLLFLFMIEAKPSSIQPTILHTLNPFRNEINAAIELLKKKTAYLDARLRQYLLLGEEFMEVVDEFVGLTETESALENDLNRLKLVENTK